VLFRSARRAPVGFNYLVHLDGGAPSVGGGDAIASPGRHEGAVVFAREPVPVALSAGANRRSHPIDVNVWSEGGEVTMEWLADRAMHSRETIAALAEEMCRHLEEAIDGCLAEASPSVRFGLAGLDEDALGAALAQVRFGRSV
jgi:hypothetical protein